MTNTARLPAWLNSINNPGHVDTVLQTLAQREATRSAHRSPPLPEGGNGVQRPIRTVLNHLLNKPDPQQFYSVAAGTCPENLQFNRYLDIEPYDRTRVLVDGTRYINANWVREFYGKKWWIAAQAPLPNTVHAFLSLVLQPQTCPPGASKKPCRIRTVVQLTQNVESGRRKAHPYFPERVGTSLIVPPEQGCNSLPLRLSLLEQTRDEAANCIKSTIAITPIKLHAKCPSSSTSSTSPSSDEDEDRYGEDDESQRVVFSHLLYGRWPDHGVPDLEDQQSLLTFLRLVDAVNKRPHLISSPSSNSDTLDPDPPIIVGCSAGVGRTGSFIALSSILRAYNFLDPALNSPSQQTPRPDPQLTSQPGNFICSPLGNLPSSISQDLVAREIDTLREQRPGMVQREEQVLLVYELLQIAF